MDLCGCRRELTHACAEGREDGGGGDSAGFGEVVTMGAGDLVDQAVGAEEAEFARDPG